MPARRIVTAEHLTTTRSALLYRDISLSLSLGTERPMLPGVVRSSHQVPLGNQKTSGSSRPYGRRRCLALLLFRDGGFALAACLQC